MQGVCSGNDGSGAAVATTTTVVKAILLGDSGVGKSSIAARFVNDEFSPYMDSTVGADYHTKTIHLDNGPQQPELPTTTHSVTFTIWDTAGQEKFHSLMPMYYRGAHVAILVFDLSKPHTLASLGSWVEELQLNSPSSTLAVAICGNKADLDSKEEEDERKEEKNDDRILIDTTSTAATATTRTTPLLTDAGQQLANSLGALYMEVSAKDSTNVHELFRLIGTKIVDQREAAAVASSCTTLLPSCGVVDLLDNDDEPRSCC